MNQGGNMKVVLWYCVKMLFSYGTQPDLGIKSNDLQTVLSRPRLEGDW